MHPFLALPLSLAEAVRGQHALTPNGGGDQQPAVTPASVGLERLLACAVRRESLADVECEACTVAQRLAQLRSSEAFLLGALERAIAATVVAKDATSAEATKAAKGGSTARAARAPGNEAGAEEGGNDDGEVKEEEVDDEEGDLRAELTAVRRSLRRLAGPRAPRGSDGGSSGGVHASDDGDRGGVGDGDSGGGDAEGDSDNGADDDVDGLASPVRRRAWKALLVARPPRALALHVNRQVFDPFSGASRKLRAPHVAFPAALDLAPFCAFGGGRWRTVAAAKSKKAAPRGGVGIGGDGGGGGSSSARGVFCAGVGSVSSGAPAVSPAVASSALYDLCGVVEHLGGDRGGHYVAYRRVHDDTISGNSGGNSGGGGGSNGGGGDNGGRWVIASDDRVAEVPVQSVLKAEALMLFYARRTTCQAKGSR